MVFGYFITFFLFDKVLAFTPHDFLLKIAVFLLFFCLTFRPDCVIVPTCKAMLLYTKSCGGALF